MACVSFLEPLGITFGLGRHSVTSSDLDGLSRAALADPCHATNMVPVDLQDFRSVFEAAL